MPIGRAGGAAPCLGCCEVCLWLADETVQPSVYAQGAIGGRCFLYCFRQREVDPGLYRLRRRKKENDFTALCSHRLSPPEASPSADGSIDWGTLKKLAIG